MTKYPTYTADEVCRMYFTIAKPHYSNSLGGILSAVCEYYSVSTLDVVSKDRHRNIAKARQIFAYIARRNGYKLHAISDYINCCHTSIVHFVSNVSDMIDAYPETMQEITAINSKIKAN
jgi:chromosomal replication initiation ATPase DnaA